jgi:hypothetical protein
MDTEMRKLINRFNQQLNESLDISDNDEFDEMSFSERGDYKRLIKKLIDDNWNILDRTDFEQIISILTN